MRAYLIYSAVIGMITMSNSKLKIMYFASFSVIVLGALGLPLLHLLRVDTPDEVTMLTGMFELLATPALIWSSMELWLKNKK